MRREQEWSARRILWDLNEVGTAISRRSVYPAAVQFGLDPQHAISVSRMMLETTTSFGGGSVHAGSDGLLTVGNEAGASITPASGHGTARPATRETDDFETPSASANWRIE